MVEVKCTGKKRDKSNNIIAYMLADRQGAVKILKPCEVKQLIREKKITVVNLTLTSDNRLVDTSVSSSRVLSEEEQKAYLNNRAILHEQLSELQANFEDMYDDELIEHRSVMLNRINICLDAILETDEDNLIDF